MTVCFFGNRDAPYTVEESIYSIGLKLLDEGASLFLVGNNGSFDYYVQRALSRLHKERRLEFNILISVIGEEALCKEQAYTCFPPNQEKALPRFAIGKRNDYMLHASDTVVTYTKRLFGGAYKYKKKAEKAGKRIIEISNEK